MTLLKFDLIFIQAELENTVFISIFNNSKNQNLHKIVIVRKNGVSTYGKSHGSIFFNN